jgi:hypothetical protein
MQCLAASGRLHGKLAATQACEQVPVEGRAEAYEPKNLRAVIPQIRATYSGRKTCNGSADKAVVDWSGEVLEPAEQAAG